jgi:hypothetical protein
MEKKSMKRVRIILAILLILLGFIFSAELYQNYFRNFCGQFYYFELEEKENRKAVAELLEKTANEKNIGIFAVTDNTDTALETEIDVYANEKAKKLLESKYDIQNGEFCSFFSGKTKLRFHLFSEIESNDTIETFYCTGTMDEVSSVKTAVNQKHATSYIHKGYSDGNNWMIWAVWGLIYCILFVLGWMVIQFEKKENFIKISMGESIKKIIMKNVITDIGLYCVMMFGIRTVLKNVISLNFHENGIFLMFFVFVVLQTMINIWGFRYDYKEIMYGANISMKTLGNCYALKVISMIASIVSIAICIGLVIYQYSYFRMYDKIEKYKDYSFLSYRIDTSDQREDEELEQVIARKESLLFYDMYRKGKISLAVTNAVGKNNDKYYLVSENTLGIKDLIKEKEEDDFHGAYILMPESMSNKEEIEKDAIEATKWDYEGFQKDFEYKIITYNQFELLYFDTEASDLEFGFDKVENPIMILYHFNFDEMDKENAAVYLGGIQNDIMYRLDGMKASEIEQKYGLKDVTITSVPSRCEQYRASIIRVLLLNLIICIFMMILEVIIIMTIIKLEYMINAKELAIKKILGYSIIKKNGFLFLTNFLSAGVAVISVLIYSSMYNVVSIPLIVLSTFGLVISEMILIIFYIIKTEKTQATKILKGGTL